MRLGEKTLLQRFRDDLGMSRRELAEAVGLREPSIEAIERTLNKELAEKCLELARERRKYNLVRELEQFLGYGTNENEIAKQDAIESSTALVIKDLGYLDQHAPSLAESLRLAITNAKHEAERISAIAYRKGRADSVEQAANRAIADSQTARGGSGKARH